MSAGKIIGGIIALIAGALLLIGAIVSFYHWDFSLNDPIFWSNIIFAILMLVGGILGIMKKFAGGILAIIAGLLSLIGGLLEFYTPFYSLSPLSLFFFIIPTEFTYFFAIEAIIAIVGGIIILVSREKQA